MMLHIHKGLVTQKLPDIEGDREPRGVSMIILFKTHLKTILSKCAERNCIWDSLKYSNDMIPNCYFPENYPSYNLVDQGSNES